MICAPRPQNHIVMAPRPPCTAWPWSRAADNPRRSVQAPSSQPRSSAVRSTSTLPPSIPRDAAGMLLCGALMGLLAPMAWSSPLSTEQGRAHSFEVVWNSWYPTQCRKFGDNTSAALFRSFGIRTNSFGENSSSPSSFNGDLIQLFYQNAGYYPVITSAVNSDAKPSWCDKEQQRADRPAWCNGGIPQNADLARHLAKLKQDVVSAMPDPEYSGFGVFDFESWQPVFEWNGCAGSSAESIPYCNASFARVREKQPWLNASAVAAAAEKEWEAAARAFMGQTLAVAKATRPKATWGFYDYPSCGDAAGEYDGADVMCPTGMKAGNSKLTWMYQASDALFPSPYLISTNDTYNRGFLRQPMREAARLAPKIPVYYYMWYEFLHTGFVTSFPPESRPCQGRTQPHAHDYIPSCRLSANEIQLMVEVPKAEGAAGIVIWGGGADQENRSLCETFKDYFVDTLGPAVHKALSPDPAPPVANQHEQLPHEFVNSTAVFVHNEGGYKCIRIPSMVTVGNMIIAFAAGRRWYGDGCCPTAAFPDPAGLCINESWVNSSAFERPIHQATIGPAAFSHESSEGCDTDLVMKTSLNGGITWSNISLVATCLGSANALVTQSTPTVPSEVLLYSANRTHNLLMRGTVSSSGSTVIFGPEEVVRNGTDDFRNLAGDAIRLSPGPGRAIQLSANHPIAPGRILSNGYYTLPNNCSSRMVCSQSAVLVYYTDDGRKHIAAKTHLEGMDESQLLELANGDLVMYSRNRESCYAPGNTYNARGMCVAETRSTDAGQTWFGTRANPSLARSDCQASVLRHPDNPQGVLISMPEYTKFDCSFPTVGRWNGTVRVSIDGTSWPSDAGVRITTFPPQPFNHDAGSYRTAHYGYSCLSELPTHSSSQSRVGVLFETGAVDCRYSSHDGASSACQIRFAELRLNAMRPQPPTPAPAPVPPAPVPAAPTGISVQVFTHMEEHPYKCIRIPSVVTTQDGVVVAIAEGRWWTGDGCNPNSTTFNQSNSRTDLVYKRSTDGGRSFGKLSVLAPLMSQANVVVLDGTGEIVVLASGHPNQLRPNYQMSSMDNGISWTKPAALTPTLNNSKGNPTVVSNGPGRAIQLSTGHPSAPGRILSTGYTFDPNTPGESGEQCPFYSDDKTFPRQWSQKSWVPNLDESQLVELANGNVLMISRNYRNCSQDWWGFGQGICAALTRSTNAGESWGNVMVTQELTQSNCQMPILRTRSGLYMAHPELFLGGNFPKLQRDKGISGQNYDTALRINGSVRKSVDDGATWPATQTLTYSVTNFSDYSNVENVYPGAWRALFGYSCLTEMHTSDNGDRRLGLLYETGAADCHTDHRGGGCSSACQVRFMTLPEF